MSDHNRFLLASYHDADNWNVCQYKLKEISWRWSVVGSWFVFFVCADITIIFTFSHRIAGRHSYEYRVCAMDVKYIPHFVWKISGIFLLQNFSTNRVKINVANVEVGARNGNGENCLCEWVDGPKPVLLLNWNFKFRFLCQQSTSSKIVSFQMKTTTFRSYGHLEYRNSS